MAGMDAAFREHVAGGLTTLVRCWAITRSDGVQYGFTDHDLAIEFEGITFRADTGLSAVALQQTTGLSVDNSEAAGGLSDASVREADIASGRFDGAEVLAWMVNWAEPDMRWLQFRGSIGELRRSGGAFQAELRGLTDALNRPLGWVFQKPCSAVLGDRNCQFAMSSLGYSETLAIVGVDDAQVFSWPALNGFEPGWFARGRLVVVDGKAAGLWGSIKRDWIHEGVRVIELGTPVQDVVAAGDIVRLEAGCDKRMETCRLKFNNFVNFQGFPDIPTEDWMMAVPKQSGRNSGGSRR